MVIFVLYWGWDGFTCADEMLYPENRSYLDDILSYEAIGARSVEDLSLIHI